MAEDQAIPIRTGEELDWPRLQAYLQRELPEVIGGATMAVAQFHGGHANLTYQLQFGELFLVLRRPPFGRIAPGAHDMAREYRVLSSLHPHFAAAPKAYHYCADSSILGAPFVLMEKRSGVVVRKKLPACFVDVERASQRLTTAMLRASAQLHTLDVKAAQLENLGQAEGYLSRQLAGWAKRWTLAKTAENKDMEALLRRLEQQLPNSRHTAVVHNDIKLDNCQFQPKDPDVVTSLFDWDMATLGDPLLDFATTLSYWPDPALAKYAFLPVFLEGDWPDKAFLRQQYAELTGFDIALLPWYEALAFVRVAVIAQQLYRRYYDGATQDTRMAHFGEAAKLLIGMGQQALP